MNEAMPPWRTFGSGAPEPPGAGHGTEGPLPLGQAGARWVIAALVGAGGAAAAGALALVLIVLLAAPDGDAAPLLLGEPIAEELSLAADAGPGGETAMAIVVDVAGAVVRPGLHRLRPGDRVGDAIAAAGGFAPRADLEAASLALNLAQPLEDGAKVLVPELGAERDAGAATADERIDLNRAGQAELETLPGIGPVTAGKIIAARAEQPFGSVRDLRTRGLVSESVFEDLEGLIRTD